MHTRREIADHAAALGVKAGDIVLVHSSYKAVGETEGGPCGVIDALLAVVQSEGALLFPNLNIPHEFTADNPPRFDLRRGSVRKLGILPELFKLHYVRHFSLHPTHSVMGVGAKAAPLLRDHEKAGLPCGPGTPWARNGAAGGKILLLGVTTRSNTTYHCAEEQIPNSYQLSREVIQGVVVVDGEEIVVPSRLHVWGNRTDFSLVNAELAERGYLRCGKIGGADTLCLDAGGFLAVCLEKLRHNPHYFLVSPRTPVRDPAG